MKPAHQRSIAGLVLAIAALPWLLSVQGTSARIDAPEAEVASAKATLDNLIPRLRAVEATHTRPGLGPQTVAADRAFINATKYFRRGEHLSVVRELNNFLNLTQVPEPKPYLRAQFMLGRSYEEMGYRAKSLRAYFRYLSAFLTSTAQDHNELLEVLRRMIPLAADPETKGEINQLVSSMTSLDLPESLRPAVLYFAGKATANAGQTRVAAGFLDKAAAQTEDPGLKARTLYLTALLALGARDYDRADEALTEAITLAGKNGDDDAGTRDLARLALARIAVHRKKPDVALRYYALIPEGSPSHEDALFESVYVHLERKEDQEARAKALLYLARHPDEPEALQLKTLVAYLDLRAGDLASASKGIAASDAHLTSIGNWMSQRMNGKSSFNQNDLSDFLSLTRGHVSTMPTVKEAYRLFARLAELERRIADSRGEVRNTIYTMGRVNLAQLRPQWLNRAEQLSHIGDEILAVGHRLAASERHLYKERIDPIDWQTLNASERRRVGLSTPLAQIRRKMGQWPLQSALLDLTQETSDQRRRLASATADLATARYLVANSSKVKGLENRVQRLEEMEARVKRLSQGLGENLEKIRTQRVTSLLEASPHRVARKFLTQYASALTEEVELLSKAREGSRTTAETMLATDAAQAWKLWEFASAELFRLLDALDREIETSVGRTLHELDLAEKRADELQARLEQIKADIEGKVGGNLDYIGSQYSGAIRDRLAKHRKWRADIDWLGYQTKLSEEQKLGNSVQLEQQILKDNLEDLKQGVLWQWPE